MGDLGLPGSVVKIPDAGPQKALVGSAQGGPQHHDDDEGRRQAGVFIEDCAVPLEHLAEYTDAAHARCSASTAPRAPGTPTPRWARLHVRPVLNMRRDGAQQMRAIAEEAAALVRRYKGAYWGEHGDGLCAREWIAPISGRRLDAALRRDQGLFDPLGLMNPGKIVQSAAHGRHRSLRSAYPAAGATSAAERPATDARLEPDGAAPTGGGGDVQQQRPLPQVRRGDHVPVVPRDARREALTRGRANTLRLALSGQLGAGCAHVAAVRDALDLCV